MFADLVATLSPKPSARNLARLAALPALAALPEKRAHSLASNPILQLKSEARNTTNQTINLIGM